MDKISKAIKKLSNKERKELKVILKKIKLKNFEDFDIKKLKGRDDIFRIRKGRLRIIFLKNKNELLILTIERRNNNTYNI